MPPTQQASKMNDHMMFTPHQNPFIDLLLTTVTVVHATFEKAAKSLLHLGGDRVVTVGELRLFFRIVFHQAVKRGLKHANFEVYNHRKTLITYPGYTEIDNRHGCLRKFCTGKLWLKR